MSAPPGGWRRIDWSQGAAYTAAIVIPLALATALAVFTFNLQFAQMARLADADRPPLFTRLESATARPLGAVDHEPASLQT